ncbi:MAG TPA: MOSC domain-containing protein [Candidatus Acidoferrales bacterium]|jgi:MOSC domain-containing protein YiiM|nr:MOSC domain-containing protein [Candidatus Acidoferrales bacterium]
MNSIFSIPKAVLESVQIGAIRNLGHQNAADIHDKPWTTGFFKIPVRGPVHVSMTNVDGDGQADLVNHGGPDKAVLAYSADHYPKWRKELQLPEMPHGAFGENFTISGLNEELVCIGDSFRIGAVKVRVSQPRQPCWKLARRWRMHELTGFVVRNGRTGWYFRVEEEGEVEAEMPVTLIDRPNPEWTVARANQILHHMKLDLAATLELSCVPELAASWVEELQERADRLRALSPQ